MLKTLPFLNIIRVKKFIPSLIFSEDNKKKDVLNTPQNNNQKILF